VNELRRSFKITNSLGLHLRAAAAFVQAANRFKSEIDVQKDHLRVSGKSLLGILGLGANLGSELSLIISGPDAEAAMNALADLIQNKFGLAE
jgi:phosphocarrier protein HPr